MPVGQQSSRVGEWKVEGGGTIEKRAKCDNTLTLPRIAHCLPTSLPLPSLVIRIRADSDPGIF